MCDLTPQSWAPPIHLPFGQTMTPVVHDPLAKLQQALNGYGSDASSGKNNGLPPSSDPTRGSQLDISA